MSLVQNMVIHEIHGKRFLFVLHLDGSLRVWDLACNYKVFSHMMGTTTTTGNFKSSSQILSLNYFSFIQYMPFHQVCLYLYYVFGFKNKTKFIRANCLFSGKKRETSSFLMTLKCLCRRFWIFLYCLSLISG